MIKIIFSNHKLPLALSHEDHVDHVIGQIEDVNGEYQITIEKFSNSFKTLEEAKVFTERFLEEVLEDLLQKKIKKNWVEKQPKCFEYHDSKYDFRRCKGGWYVYNSQTNTNIGSLGRGKYGHAYALFLNGLGLIYRSPDLDDVKKKTVSILNGKEDLLDVYYTTWVKLIRRQYLG